MFPIQYYLSLILILMTINFSPLAGATYRWRVIIFSGILVCVATTYISVYSYEIRSFDVEQDSHSYHNKIERYQVWRISSEVMGVFPPCILL